MSNIPSEGSINVEPFTRCYIDNQISYWNFELINDIYQKQKKGQKNTPLSTSTKKEQIQQLYTQNKSCSEISTLLHTHYSYVYQVINQYKKSL